MLEDIDVDTRPLNESVAKEDADNPKDTSEIRRGWNGYLDKTKQRTGKNAGQQG